MKSQPLGDFKVLHFAAHGVSSESEPDRAALVLLPEGEMDFCNLFVRELK